MRCGASEVGVVLRPAVASRKACFFGGFTSFTINKSVFFGFYHVLPSTHTFTEQNSWDFNRKQIGNGRRVCSRIGDSVIPQFMSIILNQRYLG